MSTRLPESPPPRPVTIRPSGCRAASAAWPWTSSAWSSQSSSSPRTSTANTAGIALLSEVAENAGGGVSKALADQGFKTQVVTHGAGLGIDVEIVQRNPQHKGFVPQPKRWVVEQVNGTLMLQRRLARDYDHRPDNAASRVYWASTAGMLRRLTTPAPTWRDDVELAA